MTLWSKLTSWLSGWPEGTAQVKNEELFKEEEQSKSKKGGKKPKGLNPKKKKKSKKQGNIN